MKTRKLSLVSSCIPPSSLHNILRTHARPKNDDGWINRRAHLASHEESTNRRVPLVHPLVHPLENGGRHGGDKPVTGYPPLNPVRRFPPIAVDKYAFGGRGTCVTSSWIEIRELIVNEEECARENRVGFFAVDASNLVSSITKILLSKSMI